ncbi:hypothetical protein ACP70R_011343 [Stipagrostis hirtigluma subsp. patula]
MAAVEVPGCPKWLRVVCWIFAFAVLVAASVLLGYSLVRKFPDKGPSYSVAVAAVAGLDPARDVAPASGRPTLSPVLDLTVRTTNACNAYHTAGLPSLSTAVASYGGAFLGGASVPTLCADKGKEMETVARLSGEGLVAPRFLREQLAGELAAGEAAVDVQVRIPLDCIASPCSDQMVVCRAKIGGGLAPCQLRYVPSMYLPAAN